MFSLAIETSKKGGPETFFKKSIYLFIHFWLCLVFIAAHRLSLVVVSGGYSSLQCSGFSLLWLLLFAVHGL